MSRPQEFLKLGLIEVHLSTDRQPDLGSPSLDQRHIAQKSGGIIDGDGFERLGDAVVPMGRHSCFALVVRNHHKIAGAHIDDRDAGLFFGMFQDNAFMLEMVNSVIIADSPNLMGFIVIGVYELEGESDGVPGGAAVVVFHGVCFLSGCGFLV